MAHRPSTLQRCPGPPYSAAGRPPNATVALICSSPPPSCVLRSPPWPWPSLRGLVGHRASHSFRSPWAMESPPTCTLADATASTAAASSAVQSTALCVCCVHAGPSWASQRRSCCPFRRPNPPISTYPHPQQSPPARLRFLPAATILVPHCRLSAFRTPLKSGSYPYIL
ncbi:hypothetical protein K505DRAFT_145341 [Melanomma pulvis-pyrius CBS 109.77]|uniref:Uncharacterized protein n=1 Tax=Melanomma pulvis-pyrius CBS 109.77 TaxID=1314802 RepID=A0A6A6WRM8_9PLEO|nr:hypothetical protein K505DRAFT_145341 [Melanomma pulvis-pyrius CBS 109.77]